jgi:hemerythrin superfamily protein
MAQGTPQTGQGKSPAREAGGGMDALKLLTRDHREVEQLFKRFEQAKDEDKKGALAARICRLLQVHAQIEEELFYPAARDRIEDEDLVEEALVEHQAAKDLIEKIQRAQAGGQSFDAQVKDLQEQVQHHVQEEERELFPEARESGLDLDELGRRLMTRRTELLKQMGADVEGAGSGRRPDESRSFRRAGGDRGESGDLRAREYRDEKGQIHHHTRAKMQEERRRER